MRTKTNTKGGFTLVELLIVIAIIALLAALLFPLSAREEKQRKANGVSQQFKTDQPGNTQKIAWDYNPPAGYGYQWSGD